MSALYLGSSALWPSNFLACTEVMFAGISFGRRYMLSRADVSLALRSLPVLVMTPDRR
jgi:hypothetical protein